jgi:hypothetical protein
MSKTLADTPCRSLYVNCGHVMCCKSTKLDILALIDRLGPDHGSMHWDLVGLFSCSDCRLRAATVDRCSSHAFLHEGQQQARKPLIGGRVSSGCPKA